MSTLQPVSIITLLLGSVCLFVALQYSAESSAFPRAISVFIILLAASDLIKSARTGSFILRDGEVDEPIQWRAVLLVFCSAPAFIVLVKLFDFEIATFVYLVVTMVLLGVRNPFLACGVSLGVLLIVKVLFFWLLDVTRTSTLIFGT